MRSKKIGFIQKLFVTISTVFILLSTTVGAQDLFKSGMLDRNELVRIVQNSIVPFLQEHPHVPFNSELPHYNIRAFQNNFDFHSSVHSMWTALSIKRLLPEISFSADYEDYLKKTINNALLEDIGRNIEKFTFDIGLKDQARYDFSWLLILCSEVAYHEKTFHLDHRALESLITKLLSHTISRGMKYDELSLFEFPYYEGIDKLIFEEKSPNPEFLREEDEPTVENDIYRLNERKTKITGLTKDERIAESTFSLFNTMGNYNDPIFLLIGVKQLLTSVEVNKFKISSSVLNELNKLLINSKTYFKPIERKLETKAWFSDFFYPPANLIYLSPQSSPIGLEAIEEKLSTYRDASKEPPAHLIGQYASTAWYFAKRWTQVKSVADAEKVETIVNAVVSLSPNAPSSKNDYAKLRLGFSNSQRLAEINGNIVELRLNARNLKSDASATEQAKMRFERESRSLDLRRQLMEEKLKRSGYDKIYKNEAISHWVPQYIWRTLFILLSDS